MITENIFFGNNADSMATVGDPADICTIISTASCNGWLTSISVLPDEDDAVCFNFERDCPRGLTRPIMFFATLRNGDINDFLAQMADNVKSFNPGDYDLAHEVEASGGMTAADYNALTTVFAHLRTDLANLVAALAMAL